MKKVWIRNLELEATDKGKIGNTIHVIDYDSFNMLCGGRWSINIQLYQLEENPFTFRQMGPMCGNCTRVMRIRGILTESNVYVGDSKGYLNPDMNYRVANTRFKGKMLIEWDELLANGEVSVWHHGQSERALYGEILDPHDEAWYNKRISQVVEKLTNRRKK